jgi:anti-sigma factor RsiW
MNEQQAGRTNGCLEADQLLAWHDGALSPREATEVMTHLEGCTRCAAEDRALLRDRRQVFELLSRLDPLPDTLAAPEAALARFHQRLAVRNTGTVLNHSHENPLMEDLPLAGSERVEVLSISVRHAPRKSRARAFVQLLTAVLVIGTLVGTMLLLLTPYHTTRMIVGAETRGAE